MSCKIFFVEISPRVSLTFSFSYLMFVVNEMVFHFVFTLINIFRELYNYIGSSSYIKGKGTIGTYVKFRISRSNGEIIRWDEW